MTDMYDPISAGHYSWFLFLLVALRFHIMTFYTSKCVIHFMTRATMYVCNFSLLFIDTA